MDKKVWIDKQKTQSVPYSELKMVNKRVTQEVISQFKQNAFGTEINQIMDKIEEEISQKYKSIK